MFIGLQREVTWMLPVKKNTCTKLKDFIFLNTFNTTTLMAVRYLLHLDPSVSYTCKYSFPTSWLLFYLLLQSVQLPPNRVHQKHILRHFSILFFPWYIWDIYTSWNGFRLLFLPTDIAGIVADLQGRQGLLVSANFLCADSRNMQHISLWSWYIVQEVSSILGLFIFEYVRSWLPSTPVTPLI